MLSVSKVFGPRQANLVLIAYASSESRGTFRQKTRSLAPLNGWTCAVEMCHDGMLKDTNSLDGAHLMLKVQNLCCIRCLSDFEFLSQRDPVSFQNLVQFEQFTAQNAYTPQTCYPMVIFYCPSVAIKIFKWRSISIHILLILVTDAERLDYLVLMIKDKLM